MAIGGDTGGGLKLANLCVLYQSLCSLYACVQYSVLPFLSVDTPMLVWDLGAGGKVQKKRNEKREKNILIFLVSFSRIFVVEILADP